MQQLPSYDLAAPLLLGAALLIVLQAINWRGLIPPQFHDPARLLILALLGLAAFRIVSILIAFCKEYTKYVRSQAPSDAYGSASFLGDDESPQSWILQAFGVLPWHSASQNHVGRHASQCADCCPGSKRQEYKRYHAELRFKSGVGNHHGYERRTLRDNA